MLKNNFVRIAIGTVLLLLIPLVFTLTGSGVDGIGWHWTLMDFVFMFVLIFGTGSLFELARTHYTGNSTYTIAAGLALAGTFLLVWINAAVGIIGDSDINALYWLVVITLFLGSAASRFKPQGLSLTLFAAAGVQMLIPVIAFIINQPDFSPGVVHVFMINATFAAIFIASGLLFRARAQASKIA